MLSANNLCKQFGPILGPTEHQSGSKPFGTLLVFLKDIFLKKKGFEKSQADDNESMKNYPAQESHRVEKCLNLESFLEMSLKIKSALKSTGKSLKSLEKSLNSTFSIGICIVDRGLNQYKIIVPLLGAAYAAPNIGTTIVY